MAEEKEKQEEKNQEEGKKSSSLLKTILIWSVVFIVQMIVIYILISQVVAPKYLPAVDQVKAPPPAKEEPKNQVGEFGEIYMVEDIIVNPKDTGGTRFVNVSVGLEYEDTKILPELEKRNIQIRDYLISFFGNKTISEMDDVSDKDSLRVTIQKDLNAMLPKGGIKAVYFSNFIIQ